MGHALGGTPAKNRALAKGRVGECGKPPVRLVAYGSTNRYRPVKKGKASGSTAQRPSKVMYFFCAAPTMLTLTVNVKAWTTIGRSVESILFQFNGPLLKTNPERTTHTYKC